jgi:hypothetical protein
MPRIKKNGKKVINAKKKGNSYERDIANFLKDQIKNLKNADIVRFERTAASGGLSEQGDIQCTYGRQVGKRFVREGYVKNFPFGFECKSNKNITLNILFNDVSNKAVAKILDQVIEEQTKLKRPVLLIAKIKNVGSIVIIQERLLGFEFELFYQMQFKYGEHTWFVVKLEEFFSNVHIKSAMFEAIESLEV